MTEGKDEEGYIPTYTKAALSGVLHESFGVCIDYQIASTSQKIQNFYTLIKSRNQAKVIGSKLLCSSTVKTGNCMLFKDIFSGTLRPKKHTLVFQ